MNTWSLRERRVPNEQWKIRRVVDLVRLVNGYPFSSESFGPSGSFPLVRIRDLLSTEHQTFVSGDVPKSSLIRNGDVIIGMDGDFNLVTWSRGSAALNQRLCALRPRKDVDMRFIAYSLPHVLKIINDLTFSTTVKHLSSSDILGERLLVPSLEDQQRIADFLDIETARIDGLISAQQRVLDLLAERRATGIHSAITGFDNTDKRPTRITWANTLPSSWQEAKLSLLARMGSGHTPSRSRQDWWCDCTIPWITTGEVAQVRDDRREEITETREKISEIGLENSAAELCPKGTVVLCRTASAGYSAVMGTEMATSQDFVTWKCGPRLDPYYLLWCLRAMRPDLLGRLAMGSTHKTIYVPDLQMLRIPLPPIGTQQQIVEGIRESNRAIDTLTDNIYRQIEVLAERREALITAAVAGHLTV